MVEGIKHLLKSKLVVIIAILGVWCCGLAVTQTSAKIQDYQLGKVYQYYLLYNQASTVQDQTKKQKLDAMGILGSGGVSGEFSYDDIVNSVNDKDKHTAESFASMMATYSTFGYMTNKVQGFEALLPMAGRILSMIILMPIGFLLDTLGEIVPLIIQLIAKLNVINLLAVLYGNSDQGQKLMNALGFSKSAFTGVVSALGTGAIIMILIGIVMMLRNGSSRVDGNYAKKTLGRIVNIAVLPVVLIGSASLLSDAMDLTPAKSLLTSGFSQYLVDDRAWAYNANFAPDGNDATNNADLKKGKGTYVDTKFNPYTKDGKARVLSINKYSNLAGDKVPFANMSLALAYGTMQSFSAVDYINYKGSSDSQYLYGTHEGSDKVYGSYYQYAKTMARGNKPAILNTDEQYRGKNLEELEANGYTTDSPFKAAIDDYKDKNGKLKTSPSTAWRDRFIYGTKNSGEKMDKYYGEAPSWEMIYSRVGTDGKYAISDQSVFLILSTIFNETGGRYYIDAPARGLGQMKAKFDSNRSTYYVVSMIGSPLFTIPGMIAGPLIQLVILLAVVTAVMSLGLIEMNSRPLRAWGKGIIIGDLTYSQAVLVYSIGIVGTILMFAGVPQLIILTITWGARSIVFPFTSGKSSSAWGSLAINGVPIVLQSFIALTLMFLYVKSKTFREKLIDLFTLPWSWALETGDRLERQASNGMGDRISRRQKSARDKNIINRSLNKSNENKSGLLQTVKNLGNDIMDDVMPKHEKYKNPKERIDVKNNVNEFTRDPSEKKKINSTKQLRQNGHISRAGIETQQLVDNMDDLKNPEHKSLAMDANDEINKLKKTPNKEHLVSAETKLQDLKDRMIADGASPEQIEAVDKALEELHSMDHDFDNDGEIKNVGELEQAKNSEHGGIHQNPSDLKEPDTGNSKETTKDTSTKLVNKDVNANSDEQKDKDATPRVDRDEAISSNHVSTNSRTGQLAGDGKSKIIKQDHHNTTNNNLSNKSVNNSRMSDNKTNVNNGVNLNSSTNSNINNKYQNISKLKQSLGANAAKPEFSKIISNMKGDRSKGQMKRDIYHLHQAIKGLNSKDKNMINQEKTTETLRNMVKSVSKADKP